MKITLLFSLLLVRFRIGVVGVGVPSAHVLELKYAQNPIYIVRRGPLLKNVLVHQTQLKKQCVDASGRFSKTSFRRTG